MSSDYSLYKHMMVNSLLSMVTGGDDYFHRRMCREISRKFSMPLDRVESMPQTWLLRHYYESVYEDNYGDEMENWPQLIDSLLSPEGSRAYEEELQEWIDAEVEKNRKELEAKKKEKTPKRGGAKKIAGKLKEDDKEPPEGPVERISEGPRTIVRDYSNFEDNPLDEPEEAGDGD